MLKRVLRTLLILHTICSYGQWSNGNTGQFGINNSAPNFNPSFVNGLLQQINSNISPACSSIEGIGLPILAIKQVLQNVNISLSYNNPNTSSKIIFFKEKKNSSTYQTTYKLVTQIKDFSNTNYLAIEGVYRQMAFPAFEVTTYFLDSNLDNIKAVLAEYAIDPNSYVGCGDVKSIYSEANPQQTANPNVPAPYGQNSKLVNTLPTANANQGNVDPNVIAQIIKLLQNKN